MAEERTPILDAKFAARIRDVSVTAIATVIGGVLTVVGVYLTGWFAHPQRTKSCAIIWSKSRWAS